MKLVLVIGATGALGQAVVTHLRSDGYRVIPASRHCDDVDGLRLDICDYEKIAAAINQIQPDLILNFAGTYSGEFKEAYAVNVDASRHLLDTVLCSNKRNMRVLLIGSAAEYGMVQPEENPVREDRVLKPLSVYGLTKAWQTQLAGLYASLGVDVVVARPFNLYGQNISERLFIGRLQKQIDEVLAGQKSVIEIGPLSAIRDYVSVTDAADQLRAIIKKGETGHVYHVASGVPVTMRHMLDRYLAMFGLDASIVHEGTNLTNRVGYDVPAIYADITSTLQLMNAH